MSYREMSTLQALMGNITKTGTVLPKDVEQEYSTLLTLHARLAEFNPAANLAEPLIDALAAGRDPLEDAAVLRAAAAVTITGARGATQVALDRRAMEFGSRHTDAIVNAMRTPFDAAAATMSATLDQLGVTDLDNISAVLNRGGNAAELWAIARQAEDTITKITLNRSLLYGRISRPEDRRYKVLAWADIPPAQFIDDFATIHTMKPSQVDRAGFTLSLADASQYAERVAAVADQRDINQNRERDALQARMGAPFRFGPRR